MERRHRYKLAARAAAAEVQAHGARRLPIVRVRLVQAKRAAVAVVAKVFDVVLFISSVVPQ